MKLHILPHVLFDEFPDPEDETIIYCFFTQPKCHPYTANQSKCPNAKFYCSANAYPVMVKLKSPTFNVITERRIRFKKKGAVEFSVRCVPTGNPSGSVMLLIEIGDEVHLYTGQFTAYRDVIDSRAIAYYKDRLNDIYVDNTVARLNEFGLLKKACQQIEEIVNDNIGSTILLHTDIFGYEELIHRLAQNGIKIKLNTLQKILFEQNGHSDLFNFDGQPQIKIYSPIGTIRELSQRHYELLFERRIIHIKLILINHEMNKLEKIPGLFVVPYTPHPSRNDLFCLFKAIEPKRIYPLYHSGFADDPMCLIPNDILPEDCEVMDLKKLNDDKPPFFDELEESQESLEDSSEGLSPPLQETCNKTYDKDVNSKSDPVKSVEIQIVYTIDDDEKDDDPKIVADSSSVNANIDDDTDDTDDSESNLLVFPD
ncbi:uncharacterized protein LOC116344139 isoform X2 [Contarinia nasturtii]|uniref:uncharacterized protein LOC116344139 isoform X2 n=1 Tax=Contarinia nasturtii TaxID=265458 RepID=UPI0012D3B21D|nr:uncharacterized protein LOC116344139 isoform X2 [Contarinia nasturtii]